MTVQYKERTMKVDEREYYRDLKIIGEQVCQNWWRKEGHRVDIEDVLDILSAKPHILVIGKGYAGFMQVTGALRSVLKDRKIGLIAENTPQAVRVFNRFRSQGKNVAGAFHLTC